MDTTKFANRHIGISEGDLPEMLQAIGVKSLDELIDQVIPSDIRLQHPLMLPEAMSEHEFATHISELASKNEVYKSYIGMGWYDTVCPAVIYRNVFENPVWYTSYTPYQAEISQGRLEALINFQTVVSELTGLPLANCSLLDEATAAAEAASMLHATRSREQIKAGANTFFVDRKVFESTRAVLHTRLLPQGIEIVTGDYRSFEFNGQIFGALVQYPNSDGSIEDYRDFVTRAHGQNVRVVVAADLLSLALLTPPGEWGADVALGSTQRLGIPLFYGGPSAAYFSTKEEYKRAIPGRIIGLSKDVYGHNAFRMALQTREQHIKREKATSNICTAQALLATMAGFYAVYHGADGLKDIASRIHSYAGFLSHELERLGYRQLNKNYFDTLKIDLLPAVSIEALRTIALECGVNLRYYKEGQVGISLDETTQLTDIGALLYIFSGAAGVEYLLDKSPESEIYFDKAFLRTSDFLQESTFKLYHSETELMRYIKRLERRDISLAHSMISLGSCTMKLNAASELLPLGLSGFQNIHPYAPEDQVEGYAELIGNLSSYLAEITGLKGVSLQPNSGAAGEYAGLRVIRSYLESIGEGHRNTVLLPSSAHGTNPASAVQCGYETVTVKCDEQGNIDLEDFRAKAEANKEHLAATMITYPSTHGIFETDIREMCQIIHDYGAQFYMDGANMNAQTGLTNPGKIGADVCHLNLHKTFASPHGGGGPGVGPICVAPHLIPFLPSHPVLFGNDRNTVSAAPFGSAGILPIAYAYIRMLGTEGLTLATKIAILNANYLAAKLKEAYGIVYTGATGRVGHELILEFRPIKERSGIDEGDIAKRLMDFGYHAPTLSFPVHGTLMIEPTESESKRELDRFVETMLCIREEIREVEKGKAAKEDNVLKNAPHPEYEITSDEWKHPYSRSKAAYPLDWLHESKFWINVARVDNAYGDRNLIPTICGCE
ncbi:aminomethyl-transferring glycine dehydrogenase [Parabacteroides sp. Marseille-P3160]|uniref:aminomethyl-transferring glycine dehydrogenase n=1 Tax=Parabacteroides sp. Marseille-P3160 TaxID=1917887 RepID=UPI0009BC4992|nr:aminomethyl-transferring glycine dehydrogenase [Parabacteroides sp. Marseille-P3160]